MRAARDDQTRLRVTAERLRQHPGELRLTIWHVSVVTRRQRLDDLAERRKRLIDALRFVKGLTLRTRLGDPLRPGQIDQVELADLAG